MSVDLSVYLVTDAECARRARRRLVDIVLEAVAGGVTTVQVREKQSARAALELVASLGALLPRHVTLLVNDRVDVCLAAQARGIRVDGVHVGQDDLAPSDVRALIGSEAVLGLTAHTAQHVTATDIVRGAVTYVGIGAVRATTTKADAPDVLGVHGVAELAALAPVPAVAIGGVTPLDATALRRSGLAGVAVASYICASDNPRLAAHALATAWREGSAR